MSAEMESTAAQAAHAAMSSATGVMPCSTSLCRPSLSLAAAVRHTWGLRLPKATLIYPGAPQDEPGMRQIWYSLTSQATTASSSVEAARVISQSPSLHAGSTLTIGVLFDLASLIDLLRIATYR